AGTPPWLAGAVRVAVSGRSLTVAAEPKIPVLGVKHLNIEKAVDDRGQPLTPILNESHANSELEARRLVEMELALAQRQMKLAGNGNRYNTGLSPAVREALPLRFKPADKPSKLVKALKGVLTLTVQTPPEPMITVDDVLKAAGKTAQGA